MKFTTPKIFEESFESIKVRHPSIANLNDDTILEIKEVLEKTIRNFETKLYIYGVFAYTFLCVSYFFIIFNFLIPFASMQTEFSILFNLKNSFDYHIWITIILSFILFVIIVYTILIPADLRYGRGKLFATDRFRRSYGNMDLKSPLFIGFALVMYYLAIFILLIFAYSYPLIPIWILDIIMLVWLMIPILILAFFPTFIFILILFLIFKLNNKPNDATPITIIILLVCLIKRLDDADEFTISQNNFKKSLVKSIILISDLMNKMYLNISSDDITSHWAIEQMERAASNFISLATCIYFPKSNTLENLRNKLCIYLNIFLSGNYNELPREEVNHFDKISFNQKLSKVQKITILFSFFTFMAFPIVVMAIIEILFQINIQPFIQSLLTVLYIIWAIIGLIYFSDNLTSDTKELLIDSVKFIIRKQ